MEYTYCRAVTPVTYPLSAVTPVNVPVLACALFAATCPVHPVRSVPPTIRSVLSPATGSAASTTGHQSLLLADLRNVVASAAG